MVALAQGNKAAETVAVKRNHWTNQEIRTLQQAHGERKPTLSELAKMIPLHTLNSVAVKAYELGLRGSKARTGPFA